MSSSDYEKMSDVELRSKLKANGYDLPISINRDFLVRKLQQVEGHTTSSGRSLSVSNGSKKKRLSLNVSAQPVPINTRPARYSIAPNQPPPTQPTKPQPVPAPPTPPRSHKKSTPPRQAAKPLPTPLSPPSPAKTQKSKAPSHLYEQKIPFTNKHVAVNGTDEDSEDEMDPVLPPRRFIPYRNTASSLHIQQPPTPPSVRKSIPDKRLENYMKLFNNDTQRETSYETAGMGSYSSDDDDSGDERSKFRKSRLTPVRRINWSKYKDYAANNMPSTPNTLLTLILTFFMLVIGVYLVNKYQNLPSEPVAIINNMRGEPELPGSFVPICEHDTDDTDCIPSLALKDTRLLFKELRDELNQRRWLIDCKSPDDELASDYLSIVKAKSLLYRLSSLSKPVIDTTFQYLLYLIIENPKLGLTIETDMGNGERTRLTSVDQIQEGLNLYVTTVSDKRAWYCTVLKTASNFIAYLASAGLVCFLLYGVFVFYSYYEKQKVEKQRKLFMMVENILGVLQEHHENLEPNDDDHLAIHHIRDSLIQPSERTPEKMAIWEQAIDYILNNESRVRLEISHIKGEEYRVLKWLPTISPRRANSSSSGGWQGPAFEIVDGSPNSLPKTPTNCLKIRNMFDITSPLTNDLKSKIEAALNSKVGVQLKHIGYENHNDSCVYIKCHRKEDAKAAYVNLHGWWYNGKLLGVKFLKEERYDTRFPEAKERS